MYVMYMPPLDFLHYTTTVLLYQTVVTRNKLLIERKQKKAQKGRHGKRLGGVVKRAMKASKMQK